MLHDPFHTLTASVTPVELVPLTGSNNSKIVWKNWKKILANPICYSVVSYCVFGMDGKLKRT